MHFENTDFDFFKVIKIFIIYHGYIWSISKCWFSKLFTWKGKFLKWNDVSIWLGFRLNAILIKCVWQGCQNSFTKVTFFQHLKWPKYYVFWQKLSKRPIGNSAMHRHARPHQTLIHCVFYIVYINVWYFEFDFEILRLRLRNTSNLELL